MMQYRLANSAGMNWGIPRLLLVIIASISFSYNSHSQSNTLEYLDDNFSSWSTKIVYASLLRALAGQVEDSTMMAFAKKLDYVIYFSLDPEENVEQHQNALQELWESNGMEMTMSMSSDGMESKVFARDDDGVVRELAIRLAGEDGMQLILFKGGFTFGDLPFINLADPFNTDVSEVTKLFDNFDNLIKW